MIPKSSFLPHKWSNYLFSNRLPWLAGCSSSTVPFPLFSYPLATIGWSSFVRGEGLLETLFSAVISGPDELDLDRLRCSPPLDSARWRSTELLLLLSALALQLATLSLCRGGSRPGESNRSVTRSNCSVELTVCTRCISELFTVSVETGSGYGSCERGRPYTASPCCCFSCVPRDPRGCTVGNGPLRPSRERPTRPSGCHKDDTVASSAC